MQNCELPSRSVQEQNPQMLSYMGSITLSVTPARAIAVKDKFRRSLIYSHNSILMSSNVVMAYHWHHITQNSFSLRYAHLALLIHIWHGWMDILPEENWKRSCAALQYVLFSLWMVLRSDCGEVIAPRWWDALTSVCSIFAVCFPTSPSSDSLTLRRTQKCPFVVKSSSAYPRPKALVRVSVAISPQCITDSLERKEHIPQNWQGVFWLSDLRVTQLFFGEGIFQRRALSSVSGIPRRSRLHSDKRGRF